MYKAIHTFFVCLGASLVLSSLGLIGAAPAFAGPCPMGQFGCHEPIGDVCWRDHYRRPASSMVCDEGEEYSAGLCYPQCAEGYKGVLDKCKEICAPGYRVSGRRCVLRGDINVYYVRDVYSRGAGQLPSRCPDGLEKSGGLCYPPCEADFEGRNGNCVQTCESVGMVKCGAACADNDTTCAVELGEMIKAPVEVALNIALLIAGGASASSMAEFAAETFSRESAIEQLASVFMSTAIHLGTEIPDTVAQYNADQALGAAVAGIMDPAMFDPTGVAALVRAFNHPTCMGPDPFADFYVDYDMRIYANNFDTQYTENVRACADLCAANARCKSAEYKFATRRCQLSDDNRASAGPYFMSGEGYIYLEKRAGGTQVPAVSCPDGTIHINGACVEALPAAYVLTRAEADQACFDQTGGSLCDEAEVRAAHSAGLHHCAYAWIADTGWAGGKDALVSQSSDWGCGGYGVHVGDRDPSTLRSGLCCTADDGSTPAPRCPEGATEANGVCVKGLPGGHRFTHAEAEVACDAFVGGRLCSISEVQSAYSAGRLDHCAYAWVSNVGANGVPYTALAQEDANEWQCGNLGVEINPFDPSTRRSAFCCTNAR